MQLHDIPAGSIIGHRREYLQNFPVLKKLLLIILSACLLFSVVFLATFFLFMLISIVPTHREEGLMTLKYYIIKFSAYFISLPLTV